MRNMLRLLLFSLILCPLVICKRRHHKEKEKDSSASEDFGGKLVTDLRKDANVDLSVDEEYEDLRAELLAYHTALASLTAGRRSLKTTPCWQIGGICIHHKMCEGHRSLSEVAGCRNKLEVCCFMWNKYQMRDMTDKGLPAPMPWSQSRDFGGKGVIGPMSAENSKKKKKKLSPPPKEVENESYDENYEDEHEIHEIPQSQEVDPMWFVIPGKKYP